MFLGCVALVACLFCLAEATLVPGMSKDTTVPEYIDFFEKVILLQSIPQLSLSESKLSYLERTFYSVLLETKKEQKYMDLLSGLSDEKIKSIKKESIKAMMSASTVVRSADLSAYVQVTAGAQRRALMAYEVKFVELLQAALKGTLITIPLKKIKGALVSAQREYRQEGHYIVQWMGYASVAFSILALASVVYFLQMKGEEKILQQMK